MSFRVETDMHRRRRSQNLGVAVCLVLFIGLVAVLSLVKIPILARSRVMITRRVHR